MGGNVKLFTGQHGPGAPHAGLDFVGHVEDAVFLGYPE